MGRRCCCDDRCLLYSTDFATSAVLDDWTITGTGSIVTGELNLSGTSTTAVYNTAHPQLPYPPRVRVKMKGGTGSELRALLSWSGSYGFIVELQPGDGCGTLYLRQVVSGSESLLTSIGVPGAVIDEWHTVSACYDPRTGVVSASVTTSDGRVTFTSSVGTGVYTPDHVDGEYAGLGTGPTHSGTAYFDNFYWDRLWYYGDGEQDDYDAYTVVTECSACGIGTRCEWIYADFTSTDGICEWTGATSDWTINTTPISLIGYDYGGGAASTDPADWSVILHRTAYPWDARTGPISGYVLLISSGANVPYTFDVDHYHRIQLRINFTTDAGATIYGIVCATDVDNFIAVAVTPGTECGEVKLISVVAGVATDISEVHVVYGMISGVNLVLQISYFDGYVVAQIGDHGSYRLGAQFRAAAGYGQYIGIGATGEHVFVYGVTAGCAVIQETCGLSGGPPIDGDGAKCDWSKLSGDWPTLDASGNAQIDSDTELLHLNPVPVPYESAHKVQMSTIMANVDGLTVSLIFGSDSTGGSYYKAELKVLDPPSTSTLSLYRIDSGTPTLLDQETLTIPSPAFITACIVGDEVRAGLAYGGPYVSATGQTSFGGFTGISAEVPVGASAGDLIVAMFLTYRIHAGLNNWDDFFTTNCYQCGPRVACAACETEQMPVEVQITVTGIVETTCNYCETMNRTVVVSPVGCAFSYSFSYDARTCADKWCDSATKSISSVVGSIYPSPIKILMPGHGFSIDDRVCFSGVAGSVGAIINGTTESVLTVTDPDWFYIRGAPGATTGGAGGTVTYSTSDTENITEWSSIVGGITDLGDGTVKISAVIKFGYSSGPPVTFQTATFSVIKAKPFDCETMYLVELSLESQSCTQGVPFCCDLDGVKIYISAI